MLAMAAVGNNNYILAGILAAIGFVALIVCLSE